MVQLVANTVSHCWQVMMSIENAGDYSRVLTPPMGTLLASDAEY